MSAGQKCGWCLTGDFAHCVVVILMGVTNEQGRKARERTPYYWTCKGNPLHLTKCLSCQRRGVDVDESWKCRDQKDCDRYLQNHGAFKQPRLAPVTKESSHAA